jgi:hypothetical protein
MSRINIPFVGASNKSRSVEVSTQRSVNLFPELDPLSGFQQALYLRPQLASFSTAGSATIRGMATFGSLLFVVSGGTVYSIDSSGSATSRGNLLTSTGRVSIDQNATQLMFVDGTAGYIWDGSTLTQIADGDFPNGATQVVQFDGYFVVNDPANPGRFYISAYNNGTAWDATEFATAERNPDGLLAMLVNERELWLWGDASTEVWYNAGAPDFPFEPVQSAFTEWGVGAAFSPAKINGNVYWLASPGIVLRATGTRGERISTHAVETAIAGYADISDAFGYCLEWEGHLFYVLTFPTGNATWVWDESSGLWHEWSSRGIGRFRGNAYALLGQIDYVGDYLDGNVYRLARDENSDFGTPIECLREDRHILAAGSRAPILHRALEIKLAQGSGTATLNPQAMLQWSDNGGHTWSNEHWRDIGLVGEYGQRCVWRGLGQSRDRVYRLKITDSVPRTIVSGYLDLEVGRNF